MINSYSLIKAFAQLTGCTDGEIADLINMPRSTVQTYRTGRFQENLTDLQKDRILEAARNYREQVYNTVAEMELFS